MQEPTLRPIVTTTTQARQHPQDTAADTIEWTESVYRMEETDTVWLGLGSITIQRGDRYRGLEETLKVENYSADLLRGAILQLVRDQQRYSREESGFLKDRADRFLADLTATLTA